MKKYFTYKEAIENIIEYLQNNTNIYSDDIHNNVFNSDYYIIGTYRSEQALQQYGIFKALIRIQNYEKDNFGKAYTDLSDSEKVANMLYYIIGDEVIQDLRLHYYNSILTEKDKETILRKLNEKLNYVD